MGAPSSVRPARLHWREQDRPPLQTYEKAVWRLVAIRADETISDDAYDLAVSLVADIFWKGDRDVRRDVRQSAREIDPPWRNA